MAKALVFGDDTGPCLAVARSLGRRGVEVHLTTTSSYGAAWRSRYVSATHALPLYTNLGCDWLERVQELVAEHSFSLLVPTSDSSLTQLLRHREELGHNRVAVPNPEVAKVFVDKAATRKLAEELGVPVPKGALLEAADTSTILSQFPLPAVLKRRSSYRCGDRDQKSKVQLVQTRHELQRELERTYFELIEEFLPGYCRGVSVLARDGRILAAHQHRRLRQEHPTGPSSSRISEPCDPQLLDWTERMAAATKLTGVAMFEYRHAPETGSTVLLEVNPRFWGSLPLALSSGIDFPFLLYEMLVEGRDPQPIIGSRPGVQKSSLEGEQYALWWALGEASSRAEYLRLVLRVAQSALSLASGRRFDSWAVDDPLPFVAERKYLLAGLSRFLAKRLRRLRRYSAAPAP